MRAYLLTYLIIQGICLLVPLINETNGQNCSPPTLVNGRVRTRNRGKTAKYQCIWGYELMGQRYSSCVYGRWDTDSPICVRSGCKLMDVLPNGFIHRTMNNAVVMFFCNTGFQLEGSSTVYCNGSRWNSTQATCTAVPAAMPTTSCDFEQPGICGWRHDPLHDFDWRRQNKNTPSGHIGTGPSYDHTLGYGKTGYYMYIESSTRLVNDTARLLSPIYPANLTQNGCFVFYYHMYGRHIGSLHIIVRPESADLQDVVHDDELRKKYTLFEQSGNQGNVWYRGFFDLDVLSEDFQIVIEGVRGNGYVSDIALDDVALLQGDECVRQKEQHYASTDLPFTTRDSCVNRCNQQPGVTGLEDCQCDDDCISDSKCCVDYMDVCVFADSTTQFYKETASVPPPLPPSLKMTATNAPAVDPGYHNVYTITDTIHLAQPSTTPKNVAKPVTAIPMLPSTVTTTQPTAKIQSTTKSQPTTKIQPTTIDNKQRVEIKANPKLIFATTSPPFKNATGVLNKTGAEKKDATKKPDAVTDTTIDRSYVGGSKAKFIPGKKIDVGETTTDGVPKFSKTYWHYGITTQSGKLVKGGQYDVVTDKIMIASTKQAKMFPYKQDAVMDVVPSDNRINPNIITISILVALAFGVAIFYAIKKGVATKLVNQYTLLRKRTAPQQNPCDQMRFLVQEEELEHEYDAL